MQQKTMINNFTKGSVTKNLLMFALPFVLSNLLQTFYSLVDMAFIGQYVGRTGLSAVSVGGDVLHAFTFVCIGFASAGQIIISQYVGKGELDKVNRTIGTYATFIMSLGVVFSVVGLLFCDTFLRWMNVPEEAFAQARSYTIVCCGGMVFIYGYNTVSAILRGMGNSRTPFVFVAVATVINLVLDYVFIGLCGLEALGAALGTVIGQCVAFVSSVIYLYRKRVKFGFDFKLKSFIPDKSILAVILRLGIPMSIQLSAVMLSGLVVNAFVNEIGLVESAVNGVANKIGNIASIVTTGLNQAGSTFVGQNFGAGDMKRVTKTMTVVCVASLAFAAVISVLLVVFPEQVFGIFNKDPEVMELGHSYVIIGVLSFFAFASRAPLLSLVNGIGYASLGFITGILDGVVFRVGLAILLGSVFKMGLMGFWLGNVLAGYVYFFVTGPYFLSGKWRLRPLAVK